jgi:hypothetical protein
MDVPDPVQDNTLKLQMKYNHRKAVIVDPAADLLVSYRKQLWLSCTPGPDRNRQIQIRLLAQNAYVNTSGATQISRLHKEARQIARILIPAVTQQVLCMRSFFPLKALRGSCTFRY